MLTQNIIGEVKALGHNISIFALERLIEGMSGVRVCQEPLPFPSVNPADNTVFFDEVSEREGAGALSHMLSGSSAACHHPPGPRRVHHCRRHAHQPQNKVRSIHVHELHTTEPRGLTG